MDGYWIDRSVDYRLQDNFVISELKFTNESGNTHFGTVAVGITVDGDLVLRLEPWRRINDDFSPVDYQLRELNTDDVQLSEDRVQVETESVDFSIYEDGRISLDDSVDVLPKPLMDQKGNIQSNGTGFSTSQFNNHPEKIDSVFVNLDFKSDESVYGGGERFKNIDHSGDSIEAEVTQAAGAHKNQTYKSSPRFISSRGYGCLVNTYSSVSLDFGDSASEVAQIEVQDTYAELVFSFGDSISEVMMSQHVYDTGTSVPPLWSFGFWSSRNTYQSWHEVMDIAETYREKQVPCDVIHIDPGWLDSFKNYRFEWSDDFSNADEYISRLHDMGFKVCLWVYPYVPITSPFYQDASDEFFVRGMDGTPFVFDDKNRLAIVDFTNKEALDWWSDNLSTMISDGVDVIKSDFGEYVPYDTVFSNGRTGEQMRNAYPEIYQNACREAFRKADKKPLLWSRSGWLSQSEESIHWSGDAESTWRGYRTTIKAGLNATMSSYKFWSSDVGGYKRNPSDRLYGEWMKYSSFGSPHIRAHGKSPREPWAFGESYNDSKKALQERYRLLPYIYSYAVVAANTGIPIIRPMVLEDETAFAEDSTQFMLGEHILVAPYLTEDRSREVKLPDGSDWVCYWTDEIFDGGQSVNINYSQNRIIPVFVRKGSAVPVTDRNIQSTSDIFNVELRVYGNPHNVVTNTVYNGESGKSANIEVDIDGEVSIDGSAEFSTIDRILSD